MADPKKIKALAFDLDGTLLAPGTILSERAIRAVNGCMRRGLKIFIATGRGLESTEFFRASLGAEGPMIYFNGALVVDMPGNKILNTTLVEKDVAEFCLNLSRETGVYYHAYFPASDQDPHCILMAEKDLPEREMYYKNTGMLSKLGDLSEALCLYGSSGCIKVMFLGEPEVLDSIRILLEKRFGSSVYIVKSHQNYLEILNKKVSKGWGLTLAMKHCSLKKEEVIAFGDEENDLPMFSAAGFSVAPSNAKDNVKDAADLVIGSNTDDGVAAFLEEFFTFSSS